MSVLHLIATEERTSQDVSNVPGAETFTAFAQGRRALGRNHLRHNRRNPPSIYAHRMRQLFPKLRLCPILKASCSSLGPARARPPAPLDRKASACALEHVLPVGPPPPRDCALTYNSRVDDTTHAA